MTASSAPRAMVPPAGVSTSVWASPVDSVPADAPANPSMEGLPNAQRGARSLRQRVTPDRQGGSDRREPAAGAAHTPRVLQHLGRWLTATHRDDRDLLLTTIEERWRHHGNRRSLAAQGKPMKGCPVQISSPVNNQQYDSTLERKKEDGSTSPAPLFVPPCPASSKLSLTTARGRSLDQRRL